MGPARVGPAACYVLSPVPLCLTPSATSLSSDAKNTGGVLLGLRTLCAHPQRTNTIKTQQRAPSPIPRVQAVPAPVTGDHRAKQLLPVCPASATTVISWNKVRMQPHVLTGCSLTLQPLSPHSLSTFFFLCISVKPSCPPLHTVDLAVKQWCTPVGHQGHWLSSSN